MVQKSRRYAIIDVQTISEAALRPVSLVCGARGDHASSRAGPLQARGCAPTWASGIDDLTRVAAQRGIASLCGATTGRRRRGPGRHGCFRPDGALERPPTRAAAGPAMGKRLESGADRPPLAYRLPRR